MTGMTPEALLKRPLLRRDCEGYYEAFIHLDLARDSNGYGVNAIRLSEIVAYLSVTGIRGEEREKVMRMVQTMDQEYLKYQAEKNKN
jgi:hypothetical protein